MEEAILSTLDVMGWLGIILGILVLINTICGIIKNTSNGQSFNWKILFKGLGKAIVFYGCTTLLSIAFTMLPYVNSMITEVAGVRLFAEETLTTLSSVAIFTVVVTAIVAQGQKALAGIKELLSVKVATEEITWEVKEEE